MKKILWSKTILSVYNYLGNICNAIDKIIQQKANASNFTSINTCMLNDVFTLTNRLIDLSERKVTLINLKVIIENILKEIDNESSRILILRYCDKLKIESIAQLYELSERTIFRKINIALDSFAKALERKGYFISFLENMLNNEKWIKEVYSRFENELVAKIYREVTEEEVCGICTSLKKLSLLN